ncbi:hypothetical protein NMY22_g16054 [Coprinellus aureogranulatus]|nr:hypothetical protein NMY22_g16054 [Coprinellus aureogranulatus]
MPDTVDYFNLNVAHPRGAESKPLPTIKVHSPATQSTGRCMARRPQAHSLESTRDINQHKDTIERIAKAFA